MAIKPSKITRPNFLSSFFNAVGFFTRFPVPMDATPLGQSTWAWPLVGGLFGGLIGCISVGLAQIGIPAEILAPISLALLIALSGGLHEDGLADTFDGLWGGRNTEDRLRIMTDSHIGTYGALALILSLILRWSLLTVLFKNNLAIEALITSGALSRFSLIPVIKFFPSAKVDGLGALVGQVSTLSFLTGLFTCFALGAALLGTILLLPVLISIMFFLPLILIIKSKLGGYTGDTLGCIQQFTEVSCLIGLVISLSLT